MNIWILREHDVPGVIPREPILLDRPAPPAHSLVPLETRRAVAEAVASAQAGWPCAQAHDGRLRPPAPAAQCSSPARRGRSSRELSARCLVRGAAVALLSKRARDEVLHRSRRLTPRRLR